MNREGSTQAPTRHPIEFESTEFLDENKIDQDLTTGINEICLESNNNVSLIYTTWVWFFILIPTWAWFYLNHYRKNKNKK